MTALAVVDGGVGLAWRAPLHGFQLAGVARLLESDSVLLADEMGLGKTIQAIAALRILVARGDVQSALVVAPVGLLLQWRQQLRAWAPELSLATVTGPREDRIRRWQSAAHVTLVGYEVLRNDRLLPAPSGAAGLGSGGGRRGAAGEERAHRSVAHREDAAAPAVLGADRNAGGELCG